MKRLMLIFLAALSFASCNRQFYKTASYYDIADTHQIVAVLPVSTVTTGRIPKDLSKEDITALENAESEAFQISLYNELAKRSGAYVGNVRVDIQHYTETNAKLAAAGLNHRASWRMSATELAQILDVDAVIRTNVQKDRFLTDLESFGVSVAASILTIFTTESPWFFGVNRTSRLFISCSILNGTDGVPVWASDIVCPTTWNQRSFDIVDNVSRRIARRFPYRER